MNERPPDLRELVGDDVPADELERLGRVHELLMRAGPPPELPGELAEAPEPGGTVALLPKRHWRPLAALAAALALAAFGVGWLAASAGDSGGESFPPIDFRVPMAGTPAAPHAVASIAVGRAGRGRQLAAGDDDPRTACEQPRTSSGSRRRASSPRCAARFARTARPSRT